MSKDMGASADADRATAVEPVPVSPLRDGIPSADDFEDDEFDPEGPEFECAGYYPEPAGEFYCPLWGTEECDWEYPHGGMA